VATEGGDAKGARAPRPTLDDLFGSVEPADDTGEVAGEADEEGVVAALDDDDRGDIDDEDGPQAGVDDEDLDLTAEAESDEIRDRALAGEESGGDDRGHEVTSAPSDADQDETEQIVTEAVEAGSSPQEIEANESGGGRNVPPLPPKEPFSADAVEG
jgi:hypothetical protein